uniref:DNA polymerase kappa n=1 Tax=Globodera rostochiensis TaxID=31243 RepID=A0A914HAZ4_GLORO
MLSSRFVGNKAGMSFVDKERVERIIAENTSPNFESYEKKRASRIEQRLRQNRQKLDSLTEQQIIQTRHELDKVIEEMEKCRRLDSIKVHIDMDAFFAAVECRDNAQLRAIPMAVGSNAMLSTSNYAARQFGVRSAMPGFIAKKLCPQLLIVPGNFSKYRHESSVFRKVFERFDPDVVMGSLDEAYLDVTDFVAQRSTPVSCRRVRFMGPCVCRLPLVDANDNIIGHDVEKIPSKCANCGKERVEVVDSVEFGTDIDSVVRQLRFEVEQATGLTCSAGIAPNSMLAKICSDLNKPNGQFRLDSSREAIGLFLRTLQVRKVPGIGAVSETLLKALGVVTCGDLLEKRAIVHLLFSKHSSNWFLRVSLGLCGREMADGVDSMQEEHDDDNPKSTSIERTFEPTNKLKELLCTVRTLSTRLIESLPSSFIVGGRAATLKIKFANFDVVTRCRSVNFVIATADQLLPIMEAMLCKEFRKKKMAIRLLGVRLSQLVYAVGSCEGDPKNGVQLSLAGFVRRPFFSKKCRGGEEPELVELNSSDESDQEGGEVMDCEKELVPVSNGKPIEEEGEGDVPNSSETYGDSRSCCYCTPSSSGENIARYTDEDDEGIRNIDEFFDFVDDDDVIECPKPKENRKECGKKLKRITRKSIGEAKTTKKGTKRKTDSKHSPRVNANNLHKYFHPIS